MNADDVPHEVEVKLEALSDDVLGRLGKLRTFGGYRIRARGAAQLHTIYFDTADYALTRAGVALRLRRNGSSWEATAKWRGRVDGAVHDRPELTVALPDGAPRAFVLPEGPLRDQLGCVVLGRRLRPILVSEVHRVLRDLVRSQDGKAVGEPVAELALDTATLHAPDGQVLVPTYYEVEVERRAGGEAPDLDAISGLLQARFGLVRSPASKFERGLAKLAPTLHAAPTAAVDGADPVATALRKIVALQLRRLRAEDPATRLGKDAEPLHRERVAIRRLRAALRAFATAVPPRLRTTGREELRWLGGELGTVRDVDVQLANLAWRCARIDREARARLQPFRRHLEQERRQRRARLRATMESRRYNGVLLALERFASSPPPHRLHGEAAQPIARAARRAIKRSLRCLLRKGDAIGELPAPADLHALRIAGKRLRYLLDAVEPLTGKPGRKLNRELARLQDVLGRFHDAIVAAGFVRTYRDGQVDSTDAEFRRTLTDLADGELRRAGIAQAEFARSWERFAAQTRRRRRRKLLRHLAGARATPPADAAGAG